MRPTLMLLIAGCGRVGFDGRGDESGLVARYPMDDDPATGIVHAEPAAYDAQCAPCPSATAGRLGGGYAFDGTVRIVLPSSTLVGLAPFTVALWAQPAPTGGLTSLVSKPLDTTTVENALSVTLNTTDGTVAYETTVTGSIETFPTSAVISLGAWHHVAASWDGAERRLYIDGALAGSAVGGFEDSNLAVGIGADLDANAPAIFFAGTLDDVRFYDRGIAADEITALANP